MWSDNEASSDLLGCQHIVGAVQNILVQDDLLPATVGVFGDWGSGKSTIIQMLVAEIEKDKETLVLSFNGWLFEGYDDAKLALMGTIVEELASRKKVTVKGKELALGLLRRINGWRLALAGARVAAAVAIGDDVLGGAMASYPAFIEKAKDVKPEDFGQFLRDHEPGQQVRRGVREFRKDFTELLDDTKVKRLIVVVDDLDRCTPDTIIETLEAIKLFLFVPRTAFVIGADERLIEYAVRRRFPALPGDNAEVGRDYLEKLIQFPVRIPPMGRSETETYVKLLLAQRCILTPEALESLRFHGVAADASVGASLDRRSVEKALGSKPEPDLDEALAIADRIAPVLASLLSGNPRQCKRFLNTLFIRLGMAKSRGATLKRRTLAKLMLLEYLKPESFKQLARLQAMQLGRPGELAALERPAVAEEVGGDDHEDKPAKLATKGPREPAPVPAAATGPVVDAAGDLAAWRADPWLTDWARSEPALADEDLRPYFYVARDRLDPLVDVALRMTPEAQEALTKLLGATAAERMMVLTRASQLSLADAAAVFEALARRARQAEALSMTDPPLPRIFEWVEKRPELFGEFVTFLRSLPESSVPFGISPQVARLASDPERKGAVVQLLQQWSGSANGQLKRTAATALATVMAQKK